MRIASFAAALAVAALVLSGCGADDSTPERSVSAAPANVTTEAKATKAAWPATDCDSSEAPPGRKCMRNGVRVQYYLQDETAKVGDFDIEITGVQTPFEIFNLPEEQPSGQWVAFRVRATNRANEPVAFGRDRYILQIGDKTYSTDDSSSLADEDPSAPLYYGQDDLQPDVPHEGVILFDVAPEAAEKITEAGGFALATDAAPDEAELSIFLIGEEDRFAKPSPW